MSSSAGSGSYSGGASPSASNPSSIRVDELVARALEGLVGRSARVPAVRPAVQRERGRMLHERDALALDRVGDERLRRVARLTEPREDRPQRRVVVAVARLDLPAERAELRLEVAEREDLLGRLVRLELVAIHDDPEPAESVVRCGLQGLPVLALLELAVAGHHDDDASPPRPALRPRDPAPLRDAHAQRSRVRLDAGDADVRMTVEPAEAAEPRQPVGRQHAQAVERGVEAGHVMALRGEEDVAIGIVEAELGDVQLRVEEVHDDVERAEARAEMPGPGALHGDERVQPADVRDECKPRVGVAVRGADAVDAVPSDERELHHAERR